MDSTELNLAIAEDEGLVPCNKWQRLHSHAMWLPEGCEHERCYPEGWCPKYAESVDTINCVVQRLPKVLREQWCMQLRKIVIESKQDSDDVDIYNATALQRAEAYAKVKEIWEE